MKVKKAPAMKAKKVKKAPVMKVKKAPKRPSRAIFKTKGRERVPVINYELLRSIRDSEDKRRQEAWITEYCRQNNWSNPWEISGP